jgi:hypothetical protein
VVGSIPPDLKTWCLGQRRWPEAHGPHDRMGLLWMLQCERVVALTATETLVLVRLLGGPTSPVSPGLTTPGGDASAPGHTSAGVRQTPSVSIPSLIIPSMTQTISKAARRRFVIRLRRRSRRGWDVSPSERIAACGLYPLAGLPEPPPSNGYRYPAIISIAGAYLG